MPFYEYQCAACGVQVEVLQKITDAPLRKCESCGRNQLKKLVSAPVFRLKGGGWYETDFKSDQDRKRNLVDSDGESGGKEEKSDATPEGKTEATPAKAEPAAKAEAPAAKPAASTATSPRRAAKPAAARPAAARKPAARTKAGARAKK